MAIVIVLAATPLGLIDLPIIKATTIHIPVILGAIFLGPLAGGLLGATMGVCSMIKNTMVPGISSFVFSPFLSTTGATGALSAVWVSVGCRILIGVIAGWLFIALRKCKAPAIANYAICGAVGSLVNTVSVMGSIYFLFTEQYAQAQGLAMEALSGFIIGVVGANGVPEAIAACILVTVIGKALALAFKRAKATA